MAQTSGFFNSQLDSEGNFDRVYLAEQFASYFANFIGNGIFEHLLDRFVVIAGDGLSVNVGTGKSFCNGYWFVSDAQENLSIGVPDGLLNRKDNIVIRYDFGNRTTSLMVIQGVASTTPTAPALVRNSLVYDLKIAEIYVGASVSSITQSSITDTRSDNNVCGWVTGLVDQISTSDLFNQWNAAYTQSITEMTSWQVSQKAAFEAWLETLTSQLTVGAYINKYEKTVTLSSGDSRTIPLDMSGYTQSDNDIYFVYLNGLKGVVDSDYTIGTGSITVNCNGNNDEVNIVVLKTILGQIYEDASNVGY